VTDSSIFRAAFAPLARLWRRKPAPILFDTVTGNAEQEAERLYRDGLLRARRGDAEGALAQFDKAISHVPGLADAVEARAELLDSLGQWDLARPEYERARRLWSETPGDMPDRRYVFRRAGYFTFEIEAYELVRTNVRNKVLPQLAHGNALLVRGRAKEALDSYERALKAMPNLPEILALKGEALAALGRYGEAVQVFDGVLAARPTDVETLNSRGIALMALGRIAEANDDWRRQFELLPPTQAAARGCVGLRHGNYSAAFHEFGLARAKEPRQPYWLLYRLAAARLGGVPPEPFTVPPGNDWLSALIALYAGQATEEGLLGRASSLRRRTEALFHIGVVALGANPAVTRRHWREVADRGPPAMIEFAVARNELTRLGA
jgi:Flp pilus assembly protein TadD